MDRVEKPKITWKERKKVIRHKWLKPFIFVEWICESISDLLKRWAFLDILGHAGRLTILIAVIVYFMEADERRMVSENQRKAKHYQAWQIINTAQGKPGIGGRIDALQDLNKDGVSLAGVDVSEANLRGIALENAQLFAANLSGSDLMQANLCGADLVFANLSGADLSDANLSGAGLSDANLSGANFLGANLSGANLGGANLSGADLRGVNLSHTNLSRTNLENIRGWKTVRNINLVNIWGVKNPPEGFIEWAKKHGAVSIESISEWEKLIEEKTKEQKAKEE